MADDALLAKIENYLRNENDTISEEQIAKEYLMMPPSPVSAMLVQKMLQKAPQFESLTSGEWQLRQLQSPLLNSCTFLTLYVEHSSDNQLLSFSLFEVTGDEITHQLTYKNPLQGNSIEEPKANELPSLGAALLALSHLTKEKRTIFFSYHQQRVLQKYLNDVGLSLTDNSSVLSSFFRLAEITFSGQSEGIEQLASRFVTVEFSPVNSFEKGELLASLLQFVLQKLQEQQILTEDQLLSTEQQKVYNTSWPKAQFTLQDILALPETPGVYGFKDENGNFIYVGKGNNLRRRVLSYFRQSDESPKKLLQLRANAVTMITNPCGSDLEALLLEQRLISKYKPVLNSQLNHHAASTQAIEPTILLLTSTDESSVQSLWYGKGDTIVLRKLPKYWEEQPPVSEVDLHNFFFQSPSQATATAEKLICTKNLSVKLSEYDRVDVPSAANAAELLQRLRMSCEAADGSGTLFR